MVRRGEEEWQYGVARHVVRLEAMATRTRNMHHALDRRELRHLAEVDLPEVQRAVVVLRHEIHVRRVDDVRGSEGGDAHGVLARRFVLRLFHGRPDVETAVVAVQQHVAGHGLGVSQRDRVRDTRRHTDLGLSEGARVVFIQPVHHPADIDT